MNADLLTPWSPVVRQLQLSARMTTQIRIADHDRRWRELVTVLATLRQDGRCAIRIVDADCGMGFFLLRAVRYARALGFTAVEGRGIAGSSALIACARAVTSCYADPAVGLAFEVGDMVDALRQEEELPADVVLWHEARFGHLGSDMLPALRRAGDVVLGDKSTYRRGSAA